MGIYWCLIIIDLIDDLVNKFKIHILNSFHTKSIKKIYTYNIFCNGENYLGKIYWVKIKMTYIIIY